MFVLYLEIASPEHLAMRNHKLQVSESADVRKCAGKRLAVEILKIEYIMFCYLGLTHLSKGVDHKQCFFQGLRMNYAKYQMFLVSTIAIAQFGKDKI